MLEMKNIITKINNSKDSFSLKKNWWTMLGQKTLPENSRKDKRIAIQKIGQET